MLTLSPVQVNFKLGESEIGLGEWNFVEHVRASTPEI